MSIRRALLLSLGEFGLDRLPQVERRNLVPELTALYRDDEDAGIHGAAEWVLRQWLKDKEFQELEQGLPRGKFEFAAKQWCVTPEGHTMVRVRRPEGPVPVGDPDRAGKQGTQRIERDYAIASKEVTVAQWKRFRQDQRIQAIRSDGRLPDDGGELVRCGGVLQLAEQAGGLGQEPVVL